MSSAKVYVRMNTGSTVRLALSTSSDMSGYTLTDAVETDFNRWAKFDLTGLTANTQYYYCAYVNGVLKDGLIGKFKTPNTGAHSFKVAFAGDGLTGTSSTVFDAIRAKDPLLFIHLGDMHYQNISSNSPTAFRSAFDSVLNSERQGQLYREYPLAYVWDDHDYGANNSYGSSASRPAATQVYREFVPHYPLEETETDGAIYHAFEIGRVLFIITDQRSRASAASATDNSSKTMLGTAQKTWFKNLLSDPANEGKLFVWVCPRTWAAVAEAGADHWGGFTTERTELADHIKTYCADRMCILSADAHFLAIDDGSNTDYATGGGAPIPVFQAAPLDHTSRVASYGGATYSQGATIANNGQFGVMEIADAGGSTITVDWFGYDISGSQIRSLQFTATVS